MQQSEFCWSRIYLLLEQAVPLALKEYSRCSDRGLILRHCLPVISLPRFCFCLLKWNSTSHTWSISFMIAWALNVHRRSYVQPGHSGTISLILNCNAFWVSALLRATTFLFCKLWFKILDSNLSFTLERVPICPFCLYHLFSSLCVLRITTHLLSLASCFSTSTLLHMITMLP